MATSNKKTGSAATTKQGGSVTIWDVAKHAKVSAMTVSRVINGTDYVKESTREKVTQSINELGYRVNVAARAARGGVVQIGVLFSNPRSSNLGEFLMGAFSASTRLGCHLVVEPAAAHSDPIDAVRSVVAAGVDAVILPPPLCDSMEALEILWRAQLPAISFATAEPRSHSSAVLIDDFEGARSMTRHLIELGHRDIAFVMGNPAHSPSRRREEGFRAAMAEAGLAVLPERLVQGMFSFRSGMDVAHQLLDVSESERPTAIFSSNDDMAAGIVSVALGLGIKVPAGLSVAGFDDTPIAESIWPALTTVHQPIAEMAAVAVDMAYSQVKQSRAGAGSEVTHHRCKFELKLRGSTCRHEDRKSASRVNRVRAARQR